MPAGSVSQQFTYTVTDGANLQQVFKITAALGSEQDNAYNFVLTDHRVQTGFGFTLQYPSQFVYPGLTSTDFQPRYSTQPNYETTLTTSCSGLPAGLTCTFNPSLPALIPNSFISGSLIVNAANGVAPGTYNFEATASDTNASITVPASITVLPPTPIFNLTAPFRVDTIIDTPTPITFTIKNVGDEPAHNVVTTLGYNSDQAELRLTNLTAASGTCSLKPAVVQLGNDRRGRLDNRHRDAGSADV